jgi:hypothetical protein
MRSSLMLLVGTGGIGFDGTYEHGLLIISAAGRPSKIGNTFSDFGCQLTMS